MTETAEATKIQRVLKGVSFDRSPCTFIDGKAGDLRYRGYSIHDLAEHSSFEETAWLLLNGELPNARQLSAFDNDLKAARSPPIRGTCCAPPSPRSRRSIRRSPTSRARPRCVRASA